MKKVFFLLTFFVWVGGLYASASSFNSESLLSLPIVAPDTTIEFCPGTSVTLNTTYNASVDESYSWHEDSPTGSVESIEDAITVSPSGNKDFVLIVTQSDNVTETYRRIFHLQQKPVTTVVSPVVACGTYTWPVNGQTYLTDAVVTVNGGTGTNGCDSVLVLQLTVKQNSAFTDVKTACESFTWIDGQTYTDNNNTAQVVLNNTQGCDSTVTLNLIVNHAYPISNTQSVCDTYTWTTGNGTVYTTSGNYTYAHADANGCTQVDTLHLTILHRTYGDTVAEACDQYTWRGVSYTNSTDTATRVLVNVVGCDSTLTLHLTVKRSNSGDTMAIVCEQFQWWNTNYTSSTNTPTHVYTNAAGCDSTVTLHLTINRPVHTAATVTACETYTWTVGNGTTYTNSANPTWQHYDVNGCVQVDTLNLTVYHASHASNSQSVCDTYTWITGNGTVYTTSGNYTYTHIDANGCTQVDTLHLTVKHRTYGDTVAEACDQYTWRGVNYTNSTDTATRVLANVVGCDSTVTLHLTINRPVHTAATVTACETYTWTVGNGTTYTNSANPTWQHYDVNGCVQVDTLHLTVYHASHASNSQSVCDTYTWITGNGTVYTTSGNYTYTHIDANGCTQVDTLHLTVKHRTYGDTVAEACDQYTWRGVNYTNSTDTATRVLTNVVGCDSTLTLHLTVKRSNSGDTTAIVCEQFQWWNTNYTSSTNTPTHVYTNAAGCDSTVTLHLTINNPVHTAATVTACETYTWTAGNGTTYTNSANPTWQHYDVNGCVQVDTLHLTVYHASHASNSQSVCDTYTWITGNGTVYTTSGNYTYTHLDANGCTQVDTLHLTVLYSNTGVEPVAECDIFVWHGTTYTESTNAPIFVETNADGCDSVVTLHLTIKRSTSSIETIVACKDYIWHGTTYTESNDTATYTDTNVDGCDSVVTLNLTIWPYDVPPVRQLYEKKHKESQNPWMLIYPKDNNSDEFNYQWYRNDVPIHGANQQYYQLQNEATGSTVTYMVNVANSNMSVCSSNSTKTITFMAEKTVVITTYPNPSNGTFTIDITGMENVREAIFYNAYGVEVLRLPVKSNRVDVNGQLQKGVYMVSLVSADGNNHTDKIIVN